MDSFRKYDMRAEKNLADFMDRCFYSKLRDSQGNSIEFDRKTDIESQLKGIDIEIKTSGKSFLIDEKAAFYYSNAMIPTFAFEIDSIQKDRIEPVRGWFIDDSLDTDYYMLIWPNIKCELKNNQWVRKRIGCLNSFDFTIVEAMLVEKQQMLYEVERRGLNVETMLNIAKRIREITKNGDETFSKTVSDQIKIMYSGNLAENQ